MSLDKSTLKRVAYLARIKIDNSEIDKMTEELNNIMKWVEALNEVDIEDVQPMTGVSSMTLREREDKVTDGGLEDKILSNAPEKIDGSFTVPKVIE
jgi:aspartyl-tRNA(Asn)/glutamyl-tRNA(Gln) amidotransferase subunit C|tara:strand:+ start:1793 stop:2080 length:288 start_codon:yes stop_codon:yes gene_type:complete